MNQEEFVRRLVKETLNEAKGGGSSFQAIDMTQKLRGNPENAKIPPQTSLYRTDSSAYAHAFELAIKAIKKGKSIVYCEDETDDDLVAIWFVDSSSDVVASPGRTKRSRR